ncbi:MAG: ABC transporter ATP-binding protein [Actinomycetota bacterium]
MRQLIRRVDQLLGGNSGLRGQAIGYAIAGILQGIAYAAIFPILRAAVDGDLGTAWWWLGAAAVAIVGHGVAIWITTTRAFELTSRRVTSGLIRRIGEQVIALPLGWFHGRRTADVSVLIKMAMIDLGNLSSLVIQQVVVSVSTLATVLVVIAFVDPWIALVFVAIAPVTTYLFGRIRRATAQHTEGGQEVTARLLEYAHAQRILRASRRTDAGWDPLMEVLADDSREFMERLDREQRPISIYFGVVSAAFAVAILLLAAQSQNGLDTADVIALGILIVRSVEPLMILAGFATGVGLGDLAATEVGEVLDEQPLPVVEPRQHPDPHDPVALRFDNVQFAYADEPVIRDLSLVVPTGSVTAIVGPSGSGKTTLTRLAARFYDTDRGGIAVGGADIRSIDPEELMAHLSMVLQDVYLFDATIADNVRLARPDASNSEMEHAARLARLTDVIDRLPNGWETRVGEGGSLLSSGERARVGIARALLKDAPILLLDEATAAIDTINEAALTNAIDELAGKSTVLVIAHRLSTIVEADQIAVVVDGAVEQLGTHDELLAAGGTYTSFWRERQQSAGWRITSQPRDEQQREGPSHV